MNWDRAGEGRLATGSQRGTSDHIAVTDLSLLGTDTERSIRPRVRGLAWAGTTPDS